MTLEQARGLAISLPEVAEAPHFDYTSFRVGGRIFATAPPGGEYLHVFADEPVREAALATHPDFLEQLRWGKRVCGLRVLLPGARPDVVATLLRQAWLLRAPKRLRAVAARPA